MKTYTNTTRESIKSAICEAFKVAELMDYADTLVGYFCDKVEAWMTAVRTGSEKREKEAERKYSTQTGKPRYELETAMDDLKTVLRWREEIDHYIDCAVAQEMENPTKVEYECDEDEGEARLNYQMALAYKYHDTVRALDLLGLYEHTQGLNDRDFRGLLREYDII